MKNFKKLDAYFNNQLSDIEKKDFLKEIESNKKLKAEYDFQNKIITALKSARKAELKAMLNKVPVASLESTTSSYMAMLLIGGVTTLFLGVGLFYYLNFDFKESKDLSISDNKVINSPSPKEKKKKATQNNEEKIFEKTIKKTKPTAIDHINKTEKTKPTTIDHINKTEKTKPTAIDHTNKTEKIIEKKDNIANNTMLYTPKIPSFNDDFTLQLIPEENLEVPNIINELEINSILKIEFKNKEKFNFHYIFYNKKLTLYGDFNKNLFEILELNENEKVEVYFYYNSNYYYIESSSSIKPLKIIVDKNLRQKLIHLRE